MDKARTPAGPVFRWLHAGWALLGFAICLLLVFAGGGHPPPIAFAPFVLAVWAAGHLALWGAGRLAARGRLATTGSDAVSPRGGRSAGPASARLIIATIACAAASLILLIQVVVTLMMREFYPFRGDLWVITLVIWTVHAACLAGILLRRAWAEGLAGVLSFGWGGLMGWQIVDHLWRGRPVDYGELAIALAIVAVTGGYGVLLVRSRPAEACTNA